MGNRQTFFEHLKLALTISRWAQSLLIMVFCTFVLIALGVRLSIESVAYIIAMGFPLNLYLNSINDIYDRESDKINPKRKRGIFGVYLKDSDVKAAKTLSIFGAILTITLAAISQSIILVVVTLFGLIIGYTYSVPPIRLKERIGLNYVALSSPLWIFIIAGYVFGGVASLDLLIKFFAMFFLFIAISILAEMADFESDLQAGDVTLATKYGQNKASWIALISWIIGSSLSITRLSILFQIYLLFSCIALVGLVGVPTSRYARSLELLIPLSGTIPILYFVFVSSIQ